MPAHMHIHIFCEER